ncbi:MAG: hypothetical protein K2Z81_19530 [Cyanobacteria bacterium]|nr:hypothetical protein [Cyanobacteriota bacterium]
MLGLLVLADFNSSAHGQSLSEDAAVYERLGVNNDQARYARKADDPQDGSSEKKLKLVLTSNPSAQGKPKKTDGKAKKVPAQTAAVNNANTTQLGATPNQAKEEQPLTAEDELSRARQDMAKRNWLTARRHFINAIKLAPNNVDFFPELAEACAKCNDHNGSAWVMERFTQSPAGKKSVYFEKLGEAYLATGKTGKATTSFQSALEYGGTNLDTQHKKNIHRRLLQLAILDKDTDLEKEECLEMIDLSPEEPEVQNAFYRLMADTPKDLLEPLLLQYESPLNKTVLAQVQNTILSNAKTSKNLSLQEAQYKVSIQLSPADNKLKTAYANFLTNNKRGKEAKTLVADAVKNAKQIKALGPDAPKALTMKMDSNTERNPRVCFLTAMYQIRHATSMKHISYYLTRDCRKRLDVHKGNERKNAELLRALKLSADGRVLSTKYVGNNLDLMLCTTDGKGSPIYTKFTMAPEDHYWKIDFFKSGRVIHHVMQ